MKTFAQKLAELRTHHKVSQSELADALNTYCRQQKKKLVFSREQIAQWETDMNLPNMERSLVLSAFFKVSLDVLFNQDIPLKKAKLIIKNFILN